MSVKLHNLYRTSRRPFTLIPDLRAKLDYVCDREIASMMVHIAARLYFNQMPTSCNYLSDAWLEMLDWKTNGELNAKAHGLSFELVFLPHGYVLPFTTNEAMLKAFSSTTGVTHTPYWDDTDRPANMTEQQWEDRRTTVEEILPMGCVPTEVGLTWTHRVRPVASLGFEDYIDQVKIDPHKLAYTLAYYRIREEPGQLLDQLRISGKLTEAAKRIYADILDKLPTIAQLKGEEPC